MPFASTYYHHGAFPRRYVADWRGVPQPGSRAAERLALGADGDFIDITAKFHKELGGYDIDYPVLMSAHYGRRSILHSGPEQTRIYDGETPIELGFFGQMSRNEKRLMFLAGIGITGFLTWKYFRGK